MDPAYYCSVAVQILPTRLTSRRLYHYQLQITANHRRIGQARRQNAGDHATHTWRQNVTHGCSGRDLLREGADTVHENPVVEKCSAENIMHV